MYHKFLLLYSWFVRSALYFLPDIPLIMRFRGWLYGLGMTSCGKNLQVTHDAILRNLDNMKFGDNIIIANHAILWGSGSLIIDDCVIIAPHTTLVTAIMHWVMGVFVMARAFMGITSQVSALVGC